MASFRAVSREGHAAMSMRGDQDRWIIIQKNTFTNWVNEQLRSSGIEHTEFVEELGTDFESGVKLCRLVESLQGKKIRVIKRPLNHHQQLENVTLALNAIANDNVRLVNIGPEDIVNGNLKLILGLIWHLILRYQIGKTKFPTKKLMLAWLQAVIPECGIGNFTNDWNDGIALSALVDYCRPGLCSNWRHLSRSDGLNNCRNAMQLAKQNFDIPLVLRPEDLASPDLDELSGMTYLSYFMKVDSPGYHATLNMVRKLLKQGSVNNFTSDWHDGRLLCNLAVSLGSSVPGWPNLTGGPVENQQLGIDASIRLGVQPILTAKEMCDPEVDHIGIMAYAAYFSRFKPVKVSAEKVVMDVQPRDCYIGMESNFTIRIEDETVSASDIRAELKGPDSEPHVYLNWSGRTARGSFTPVETGHHRLSVFCEGQLIVGCPLSFKVLADRSKIAFSGVEKCAVGSITELTVNSMSAGQGDVQVEARAPGGRVHRLSAMYRNGNYVMDFTPSEVGVWQISVNYDGEHIQGSPFQIHVYDPAAVKVYGLEGGTVGSGLAFNADTSSAGDGDLRVTVLYEGQPVPAYVTSQRTGLYRIDFTPEGAGTYKVHCYYNDIEVRGSPYTLDIVDSSRVSVRGDGLTLVPVNRVAKFVVETGGSKGRVQVEITAPSGQNVMYDVRSENGEEIVEYTPMEVGDHLIKVEYRENEVEGSPFKAKAYDTSAIAVSPLQDGLVGSPVDFTIDVTRAGEGQLEIMVNNGNLPNTVDMEKTGVYKISFVPEEEGLQTVNINFNSEALPGSPFTCNAADLTGATVSGLKTLLPTNILSAFTVETISTSGRDVGAEVDIISPSGMKIPAQIKETSPGKYCVEFVPQEVGSHLVEVFLCGKLVKGFPHIVKVYDSTKVRVITGGNKGYHNIPVEMILDVSQCGEGQIEVVVTSNGVTIPSQAEQHGEGRILVTFIPKEGGVYCVNVTFNGESIVGSPFYMDVTGPTKAKMITESSVTKETSIVTRSQQMTLGAQTSNYIVDQQQWIWLEAFGSDILDLSDLELLILAPDGDRIPARILSQSDGNFKVEWTPSKPGRHRVEVQYAGRAVDGSPFYVDVFDLATIRIQNFRQSGIGEPASFELDLKEVGLQDFNVLIRSPSGQIVDHNVANDFSSLTKSISYIPTESGPHEIYVNYITFELPGCPYVQNIDEGGMPTAHGNGLYRGEEDKVATFYVDVGQRQGDLDVRVDGPNSIAKTTIERDGDKYVVSYIPVEVGLFDINITWNGRDVPGSPYHPKVLDARKVRISGGWGQYMDASERVALVVGEEKKLIFDVSQAGPGALRSEVVGPNSNIPVAVEDNYGNTVVSFVPEVEGNHYIHLFWSDIALPSSPFLGYAIPAQPDSNKVILTGRGLKEATVREEAEFVIDGSQAGPGFHGNRKPEVTLTGVRAEISVRVVGIGNGKYRCSYIPVVPGAYLLHITWNGRQLRGSPYKVNVIGAFYPNKVQVSGEGLRGGILGRSMEVFIDTRKAGPGELTAYCMGPNKAAYCELMDNKDGTFVLRMKPLEVGRHVLQVKYGGEHVNGSPFVLKVAAQPDASKVRVTGPGVEHGILATYQSRFIVETRGAGAGQLTVRIRGPKGGFQVEMYRDSQKDRTILCRYDPTETGLYIISIKWSGVDVPGSPFQVNIVDTQQELEQVLQESFSHSSVSQRSYSQWRQEI